MNHSYSAIYLHLFLCLYRFSVSVMVFFNLDIRETPPSNFIVIYNDFTR
nr:MAG TPA: hypothetical protein [Caudoviricetes sp.]DAT70525.1 MAG TPA: hypothetical protein [Caudoviricetes sp.]